MGKSTDISRAERKAKKRALEDAIPDLPGDNEVETGQAEKAEKNSKKRKRDGERDAAEAVVQNGQKAKKDKNKRRKIEEAEAAEEVKDAVKAPKKEKKSKKGKASESTEDCEVPKPLKVDTNMAEAPEEPKKTKKERKAERKARQAAETAAKGPDPPSPPETTPQANGDSSKGEEEKKSKKNNRNRDKKRKGTSANGEVSQPEEGKASKAARFIVFIGNLPYTATTESITAHFASVKPKSVRHLTQKDNPSKSKGCAFIEFEGYDHMKTCLKLFHHSTFDDGLSAPRKINVELTAGGGGNTKERKAKIQGKNEKLNEERYRKIQEEAKAKLEKAPEGGKTIDESAIHPSRRGRVPVA
ncbi:hypothetical protein L207DRAFT_507304 [Hyaloscypha variabilis F]|uniref:RRM domain-containing protein n=1 Tax=Hyaloscypha variabilis (strain UAMH 11265 / GT02V1 / F) TaxID=1149755 RepID=A0A2J6S6J4_HYAVF|nr:hypothetical protein L207DRAFT_507304 [Hyaloscypha variabilis F]